MSDIYERTAIYCKKNQLFAPEMVLWQGFPVVPILFFYCMH